MQFIKENDQLIKLLQKFLDIGCIIYGPSVQNLLINNKTKKLDIYIPTKECQEHLNKYKNYFECLSELKSTDEKYEIKKTTKNKTIWILKSITITFTTKRPNPKHDVTQLTLSSDGISTFSDNNTNKSVAVLKVLRKLNKANNIIFDDIHIEKSLEWINYFLNEDNMVYGSWPSRYITVTDQNEMKRDIDILCQDLPHLQKIENLMKLLATTGICEHTFVANIINSKIKLISGTLDIDVHLNTKSVTCDAFYNNLRLTKTHLTINYTADPFQFLSNLILTLNDLFKSTYTLIKPFPTRIKNKGDLRLLVKPIGFSEKYKITLDYLEFIKKNDDKINNLGDILLDDYCEKEDHVVNPELDFVPSVIKMDNKKLCLHCIHSTLKGTSYVQ